MSKKSIIKYGASLLLSAGLLLNLGSLEVLATESTETVEKDQKYFSFPEEGLSRKSAFFERATQPKETEVPLQLVETLGQVRSVAIVDGSQRTMGGYVFTKYNSDSSATVPFENDELKESGGVQIRMTSSDSILKIEMDSGTTTSTAQLAFYESATILIDDLNIEALNGDNDTAGISTAPEVNLHVYLSGENSIVAGSSYGVNLSKDSTVSFNNGDGVANGSLSVVSSTNNGFRVNKGGEVIINGGELYIEGQLGICRNGEVPTFVTMNGGYATVKGTAGVAINVAYDGVLALNGGELSLESHSNHNVYATTVTAEKGNAVLIKTGNVDGLNLSTTGSVQQGGSTSTKLLVVDKTANQTDPVNSLYGSSSVSSITGEDAEDAEDIYFARVYGDVELTQPFTVEDNWVLDIPPNTTLRHKTDGTSNLSVAENGVVRFKGVSTDTDDDDIPFHWGGTQIFNPVDSKYGTINLILSEDLISTYNENVNLNGFEYDGGVQELGSSFLGEGGYSRDSQSLWGLVSVNYLDSKNNHYGATATVVAERFEVVIQPTGNRTLTAGGYNKSDIATNGPRLVTIGQATRSFTVNAYDISNQGDDGNRDDEFAVVVAEEFDDFQLDAAGTLMLASREAISVTSPFDESTKLVQGTDYQVSAQLVEEPTREGGGDSFYIVITGLGNYQGIYVDSIEYEVEVSAGSLGEIEVAISGTGNVYVKPDGTIDLSQIEITDMSKSEGDDDYYLEIEDTEQFITAISDDGQGNLLYQVKITPNVADSASEAEKTSLEFTITAKTAGSGDSFSKGELNLVVPTYERPDCKLYAEDLYLSNADGDLDYGEHYTLDYWDATAVNDDGSKGAFIQSTRSVDCNIPALKNSEDETTFGKNSFTVRAVKLEEKTEGETVTYVRTEDKDEMVEFNVQWQAGGTIASNNFASGALTEIDYENYHEDGTNGKLYVAKDFGVVISAEELGIKINTYVEDDDSGELTEEKVSLTDADIDYVLSFDEFAKYMLAVNSPGNAYYSEKTQLVSSVNLNSEIDEDGNHATEPYTEAMITDGGKIWYLTLEGTGSYTGTLFFEVPADCIEFVDLAEDVIGIAGDALLLDPNLYPKENTVYQKPDGTLHTEDIILQTRLTTLDSNKNLVNQTMSVTSYQLSVRETRAEITENGATKIQYTLDILDGTGNKLKSLVKADDDGNPWEFSDWEYLAEPAGTGTKFRHGYLDLIDDVYYVNYFAPDDVGSGYTTADMQKAVEQLEFSVESKSKKIVYGTDFTAVLHDDTSGDSVNTGICTITVTDANDSTDSVTFDITIALVAHVDFDENAGEDSVTLNGDFSKQGKIVLEDGATFNVPATTDANRPTREGYTFTGWAVKNAEDEFVDVTTGDVAIGSYLPYADEGAVITLYAQWEEDAQTYTVKFDGNNGELGSGFSDIPSLEATHTITIPSSTPTRTGYKFDGWALSADGKTELPTGDSPTVQELLTKLGSEYTSTTITLYAQWTAVYSVVFDGNGGTLDASTKTQSGLEASGDFTLPDEAHNPTRAGFKFAGWELGDGTKVTSSNLTVQNLITTESSNTTHNFTLYAQWEALYTVVFHETEGSFGDGVDTEVEDLEPNESVTTPTDVTRLGYTLGGWALSAGGTPVTTTDVTTLLTAVENDTSVTISNNTIRLYAVWLPNSYTVTFDPNEGTFTNDADKNQTSKNYIQNVDFSKKPTLDGSYFVGWTTTKDGSETLIDSEENVSFHELADKKGTVNEDGSESYTGTLYALWKEMVNYGIYFDYNYEGKGLLSSIEYGKNNQDDTNPIVFPVDPIRAGYTFDGWYIVDDDDGDVTLDYSNGDDHSTYGDLSFDHQVSDGDSGTLTVEIIYAKWTEKSYDLVFDLDGGTIPSEGSQGTTTTTWLEQIQFPSDPSKVGFTFDGWFHGDTRVEEGISLSQVIDNEATTDSTKITATWKEIPLVDITLIFRWETANGTDSKSQVVKENGTFAFPTPTPTWTGYSFDGWYLEDTTKITSNSMADLLLKCADGTEEIVLTGKWTEDAKPTYTVTFDLNYTDAPTLDKAISQTPGDMVTLPSPDPTRTDYKFLGWTKTKSSDDTDYVETETVGFSALAKDKDGDDYTGTLYAQWTEDKSGGSEENPGGDSEDEKVTYTVKFDENQGTWSGNAPADVTGKTESDIINFPTSLSREGYTLNGWALKSTGEGVVETGKTVKDLLEVATSSNLIISDGEITIYAQWKLVETTPEDPQDPVIVTYTVTYDYNHDNKGTYTTKNSKTATDKLTHPSNPTRIGYTFEGWYTEPTCKTAVLTNSKTYSELATTEVDEENFKGNLYANWTKVEDSGTEDPTITYVVNFYQNYGTAGILSSKTSTLGSASVSFPSNPTRTNYSFDGWSTSSSGGSTITSGTFAQLTTAVSTSYYTGDLYAQWTYTGGSSGGTDSDSGSNDSGSNDSGSNDSGSNDSGSNDSSSNNSNSNAGSTEPDISVNNDVEGDRLTVDLLLKPSVSGTQLNTTVTEDAMSEALSQAGNNKDYDVTITPDYSGTTSNKDYDFTLDRAALEAFANSNAATLTVIRDDVIITFDKTAVDHILYNTLNAVIVSVDNKNLSSTASAAFGSRPSYDVSITDSTGTALSNLGDGVMKITLPFTPTASELAGNLIAGRVNYYGDIEYQIKSYFDGAGMLILSDKLGVYGITNRENTSALTNLDNHWSEEYARFTDARRLYAEINNVNLNDEITRADFVTIVGIIQGIDVSKQANPDFFHDVSSSAYYAPYVQWALENNVAAGKLDGYFDPDAAINREEMAAMLLAYIRSMNKELEVINGQKKFTDEDAISKWAEDAVQYVQTLGLIYGKDDDYFDPQGLTTFGDHAVMMMRLIESIVNIHTVFID